MKEHKSCKSLSNLSWGTFYKRAIPGHPFINDIFRLSTTDVHKSFEPV